MRIKSTFLVSGVLSSINITTHTTETALALRCFTYIDCDWSCNCTEFGNALTLVLAISTAVVDVVHSPKATTSSTDWLPLALTKQQHGMISPSRGVSKPPGMDWILPVVTVYLPLQLCRESHNFHTLMMSPSVGFFRKTFPCCLRKKHVPNGEWSTLAGPLPRQRHMYQSMNRA